MTKRQVHVAQHFLTYCDIFASLPVFYSSGILCLKVVVITVSGIVGFVGGGSSVAPAVGGCKEVSACLVKGLPETSLIHG
jgi:hypothetical protein